VIKPLQSFQVRPSLPQSLRALEQLAHNLRWSWDHETISLFRRLDRDLWERTGHNPVLMLGTVSQRRLAELATDEAFLAHLWRVERRLDDYLSRTAPWYTKAGERRDGPLVAYFSMEFGLTECLPIYSGGLGILAGDHLKSASELGVPLVGVGLLYQKGYFRQYLNPDGWQQERYPVNDFYNQPVQPFVDQAGKEIRIEVDIAGRTALVQLWRAQVGRTTLVLLDTNIADNPRDMQDITDELYGGDMELRLQQEIVLGIGGMRALDRLGMRSHVYHMNEGHSAFVGLERIRLAIKERGLSFDQALEVVVASTVFTTHTPVPAGIDVFQTALLERYLARMWRELGVTRDQFLALGRLTQDPAEPFNMAVLAIHTAGFVNGVSRLHGEVSRGMWQRAWPGVPESEVPIAHITNGVHAGTWISKEMQELYARYLGPEWSEEPGDTEVWRGVNQIPAEELWRTHERRRERLVAFARRRLAEQLERRGAARSDVARAEEVLDPEALTIGFARRFATYKRATLLLRDPERLARILTSTERPVQIIFAGKAHPRDDAGKSMIRDIVRIAAGADLRSRLVFLEDYDFVTARYLVQGCDVWLNTPRRPREASGTSGMKAAFNGVLNLSIPDGWWDEAYSPRTGWAIGRGESYAEPESQDRVESGALYELLEREVVPLFFQRGRDGLPRGWIELMKSSMEQLCPRFNSNRMVHQYVTDAYLPASARRTQLEADDHRRARELAAWRHRVADAWPAVRVTRVEAEVPDPLATGQPFEVRAWVSPGGLAPDDLAVQVYVGPLDDNQAIVDADVIAMTHDARSAGDEHVFTASVARAASGMQGFAVRVMPRHQDQVNPFDAGAVVWSQGSS